MWDVATRIGAICAEECEEPIRTPPIASMSVILGRAFMRCECGQFDYSSSPRKLPRGRRPGPYVMPFASVDLLIEAGLLDAGADVLCVFSGCCEFC